MVRHQWTILGIWNRIKPSELVNMRQCILHARMLLDCTGSDTFPAVADNLVGNLIEEQEGGEHELI